MKKSYAKVMREGLNDEKKQAYRRISLIKFQYHIHHIKVLQGK